MKLPHGWTERFTLGWLMEQHLQQSSTIESLVTRVEQLEREIARLDVEKASKAGRKPRKPLSGDRGNPIAQG